ncbi:MAG: taurine catabolism dioxygenase TauD, TfdA family protein [Benjaminiella poitrasii]|nr:MAG: taurine catabolism dioxygenase TauD, TfdA family protein [Benjaminiella poitrasii]
MSTAAIQQQPNITSTTANKNKRWRGFSLEGENHTANANFPLRITGPSVWDGKELEGQPEKWLYHLTSEDIDDIDQAMKHFLSLDLPLTNITPDTFPLQHFQKVVKKELNNLFNGLGFGLLRGFPISRYEREEQAIIFMGIGSYIGIRKPQNGKGHVLGHVKDLTENSTTKKVYHSDDPTTRIYATRKAQPFHVDGADVVALICLSEGQEGGLSSIISSHTVYNRLQELRPDIVELLKQPWLWDRKGEHAVGEAPYLAASPLTYYKDHLFTFWGPHFFETVNRFPDVTVEEEKFEAMRYIQELCEREALSMNLKVGDIQFVQNYQILHARTGYLDAPGQTRHLLRLWFTVNAKDVGWEMPFEQDEYNYNYQYAKKQVVPLEAE